MSLSKLEEVKCPCGEVFEAELWNSIDPIKNPELKEQLICGEINVVSCPLCKQIFYAEHFVLYVDTQNELIAFVYPVSFSEKRDFWNSKMETDFKKVMEGFAENDRLHYEPVLLFGLDALVNLINEFDQIEDESTVLKYTAPDLGLSVIYLHPYHARLNNLPNILPVLKDGSKDLRQEVLKGLERFIKHNEKLACYNRLYELITADKSWSLNKELIKQKQNKNKL